VGDNIAKAMLVTVWVDDLIIVTGDAKALVELKTALTTKFKMKDLGKIAFCLGMEIKREPGKLTLHQSKSVRCWSVSACRIASLCSLRKCLAPTSPRTLHLRLMAWLSRMTVMLIPCVIASWWEV
jgi:hypothetical protein